MGKGRQKGRQLVSSDALVWAEHPLPAGNVLVLAGALKAFSWHRFPSDILLGRAKPGEGGLPWAPWAAERAPLGWDSKATGTVTLQRWHRRNLTAAVKGKRGSFCYRSGSWQHAWLGSLAQGSGAPSPSPVPQPSASPQTASMPPPKMSGQCHRLLGEAQPSGPGTSPAAVLSLPCCRGTGCVVSLCNGFWPRFGAAVVMGGCGEELVVMPHTNVASS